jgi:hypothetical protein
MVISPQAVSFRLQPFRLPYSFSSVTYICVRGAKTTGPVTKKFEVLIFFVGEKFQVAAHEGLSDETKNRGPLYLSVYARASKRSHTGGQ